MRDEDTSILCSCSGTRRAQIVARYQAGLTTLEALSDATGMMSGCGGCEWDLRDLIKALAEGPGPTPESDPVARRSEPPELP